MDLLLRVVYFGGWALVVFPSAAWAFPFVLQRSHGLC